jgi:uncharacterized protein (UPF0248 family)
MPYIRDILNEIKWTKDIGKVTIWYIHRGAANSTKTISGTEITSIGGSSLETATAKIPYHRITKIIYDTTTVFDRWALSSKDKQL